MDYLLKPVSRARLAEALSRVRSAGRSSLEEGLDRTVRGEHRGPVRFLVKSAQSYAVVNESRVLFFSSEGGLTRLICEAGQYLMKPTLNELEQRLDPGLDHS